MTIEKEIEQEDLRELLNFSHVGLLEYSADPTAERRVGKLLTDATLRGRIKKWHHISRPLERSHLTFGDQDLEPKAAAFRT